MHVYICISEQLYVISACACPCVPRLYCMCVCIHSRVCMRQWEVIVGIPVHLTKEHDNMATHDHKRSGFVSPEDRIMACHCAQITRLRHMTTVCDMLYALTERPTNCSQVETNNQELLSTIVDDKVELCCCTLSVVVLFLLVNYSDILSR